MWKFSWSKYEGYTIFVSMHYHFIPLIISIKRYLCSIYRKKKKSTSRLTRHLNTYKNYFYPKFLYKSSQYKFIIKKIPWTGIRKMKMIYLVKQLLPQLQIVYLRRRLRIYLEKGYLQVSLCWHWEKSGLLAGNSPPLVYLYQIKNISIQDLNTKNVSTFSIISLTMV